MGSGSLASLFPPRACLKIGEKWIFGRDEGRIKKKPQERLPYCRLSRIFDAKSPLFGQKQSVFRGANRLQDFCEYVVKSGQRANTKGREEFNFSHATLPTAEGQGNILPVWLLGPAPLGTETGGQSKEKIRRGCMEAGTRLIFSVLFGAGRCSLAYWPPDCLLLMILLSSSIKLLMSLNWR